MEDSRLARPNCRRRSEDSVEDLVEYEFSLDADTPSLAQSFFLFSHALKPHFISCGDTMHMSHPDFLLLVVWDPRWGVADVAPPTATTWRMIVLQQPRKL